MRSPAAQERAERISTEPFRAAGSSIGFVTGTLDSIKDVFAHKELLNLLVRREIRARYKDSILGFFWSLMRPLTQLLIYYLVLGEVLGNARHVPDFAIFVFTGLAIWQLFSEILSGGTASIIGNSGLIKKIYLPRELFPLSSIGSAIFNFLIQLAILIVATFLVQKPPTGIELLYFPLSVLLILVFATAFALLCSAANVYLRDIQYLVEVALMVLFWASPIVYSYGMVLNKARDAGIEWLVEIYLANPITLAVLGFQKVFWMAGRNQPWPDHLLERMGIALLISVILLWLFQRVFARLQANFAQEL